jgi:hypothetical protein
MLVYCVSCGDHARDAQTQTSVSMCVYVRAHQIHWQLSWSICRSAPRSDHYYAAIDPPITAICTDGRVNTFADSTNTDVRRCGGAVETVNCVVVMPSMISEPASECAQHITALCSIPSAMYENVYSRFRLATATLLPCTCPRVKAQSAL